MSNVTQLRQDKMIKFYCPKCGEYSVVEFDCLAPGRTQITCIHCQTAWDVIVSLWERTKVAQ